MSAGGIAILGGRALSRRSQAVARVSLAVAVLCLVQGVPAAAATTAGPRPFSAATAPAPHGSWITNPHWIDPPVSPASSATATPLPVFVKAFTVARQPVSAVLSIAGEGIVVPTLNGAPVGKAVLEPGYSADTVRVDYTAYDVTPLVTAGENRVAVQLGTGMYAEPGAPDRYLKLPHVSGPIGFVAELTLTYADGSQDVVESDTSWETTLGDTTYSGWYGGEDADLRRLPPGWQAPGVDVSAWDSAVVLSSPVPSQLTLTRRIGPPVEVVGSTAVASLAQVGPERWIADFGVNEAGWPQISVAASPGTRVALTPAETLSSDRQSVDQRTMGVTTQPVYDSVTLAGSGTETWHPQFVYHGFRYLQVDVTDGALAAPLSAAQLSTLVLRTAVASAGSFTSSDPVLNAVHALVDRAMQSNMFSTLTDCPNREKLGWLEQTSVVFDTLADNYDMSDYGRRLEQNMVDSQHQDGLVPDIAPEYVALPAQYREDPNWGGSIVLVPWLLFQDYGDVDTMAAYYPNMVRYVDHLGGMANGGLVTAGLGDWLTLDSRTPRGLVVALGYERVVSTMALVSKALGKSVDEARFASTAAAVLRAINDRWLRSTGDYGPDQASNAVALDVGVVPAWALASTRSALLGSIAAAGGHLRVGEIGLPAVLRQLSRLGRDDIAYRAVVAADAPGGFGYIVASGATALTEEWGGQHSAASQNHVILGTVDDWLASRVAGIQQAPGTVGFRTLVVSPAFVPGLASASASRVTPFGTIEVSWQRTGQRATVDVTVPDGAVASLQLPSGSTTLGPGQHSVTTSVPGLPTTATPPASPWRASGRVLRNALGLFRLDARTRTPLRITPEEYAALGRPAAVVVPSFVARNAWSPALWLVTRWTVDPATWTSTPLDTATWSRLGRPVPRTGTAPGTVYGAAAHSPDIWVRTPDGAAHRLSHAEFVALGRPRRVSLLVLWSRYPGSTAIWSTQTWPGGARTGHPVSPLEWRTFGSPRPGTSPLVPGATILRWGASRQLFLRTPDGLTRSVSSSTYRALGSPRPVWRPDQAFVQVPGSPKILRVTDTASGAGYLVGPAEWAAYGRPIPEWRPVPHLRWTSGAAGIALELTGGTRIAMSTKEWVAAGSPTLDPA